MLPRAVPHPPNVPSARGGELAGVVRGEADAVDVLREGLAAEDGALLPPVPHGQHEVWVAAHRGQQLPLPRAEVHVAVHLLRTTCREPGGGGWKVGGGGWGIKG